MREDSYSRTFLMPCRMLDMILHLAPNKELCGSSFAIHNVPRIYQSTFNISSLVQTHQKPQSTGRAIHFSYSPHPTDACRGVRQTPTAAVKAKAKCKKHSMGSSSTEAIKRKHDLNPSFSSI